MGDYCGQFSLRYTTPVIQLSVQEAKQSTSSTLANPFVVGEPTERECRNLGRFSSFIFSFCLLFSKAPALRLRASHMIDGSTKRPRPTHAQSRGEGCETRTWLKFVFLLLYFYGIRSFSITVPLRSDHRICSARSRRPT